MARRRLVDAARLLRRHGVRSERMLWDALRDRRLDGVRLKRQQPIDRYVVDFFAPAAGLVVEVDGSAHDGREHMDETRQAACASCVCAAKTSSAISHPLSSASGLLSPSTALRGRGGTGGEGFASGPRPK